MYIEKVIIHNFKCFGEPFCLELSDGLNVLVGDNEAGKSTILEAIHLVLTGLLNGRYLKNELSPHLFNNDVVAEYIESLKDTPKPPPEIRIDLFFKGDNLAILEGDGNSLKDKTACGVSLRIAFDDQYKSIYQVMVEAGEVRTIPVELYSVALTSFARDLILPRVLPIKAVLIDSSTHRFQNGGDVHLSHIIGTLLSEEQKLGISQAHRKMKELFRDDEAIKKVNTMLEDCSNAADADKVISLSVDFSTRNAWENSLATFLDDVPFSLVGKGEQSIVKTQLALENKKAKEASIVLLEEPENHLSFAKLNQLIRNVKKKCAEKQIIVSTHSSFVANKLGLESLILLSDGKSLRFNALNSETEEFFEKIPGYDTLRVVLCEKAILVEGDCDELIVQRAYYDDHGVLPIENCIDVISVGTSFLRFLDLAELLRKPVVVVTDNDGDVDALKEKYGKYINDEAETADFITICFDEEIDEGELTIGKKKKAFNYNTLEPKLLKVNSLDHFNQIFGTAYTETDDMHKYMKNNKTECALRLFKTDEEIVFPQYIKDAIN
jgi:putative ATP-dependent endonuclease of OLD family